MRPRWRLAGASLLVSAALATLHAQQSGSGVPQFEVDHRWPQMPDKWALGQVSGLAVDRRDHIWVIHRPSSLDEGELFAGMKPPHADCCVAAPPVLEFDQNGKFIQGWGGPDAGYEWPTPTTIYPGYLTAIGKSMAIAPARPTGSAGTETAGRTGRAPGDSRAENAEHGIYVDPKDNVWLAGNGEGNHQLLKFTRDGKFLLQIGRHGQSQGSNDTQNLNQPTGMQVYPPTNEIFVSDGYGNRRVIVFDADTGAYKRHWGAYGKTPDDTYKFPARAQLVQGPPPPQFNNPVHSVVVSSDDLVYVADRTNNRLQVFRLDGTFVKEMFIARNTLQAEGTVYHFVLSPDKEQKFLYVVDGSNKAIRVLNRQTLEIVANIGGHAGHNAREFFHVHSAAGDSKGNLFIGEVNAGQRYYRYAFKGMGTAAPSR